MDGDAVVDAPDTIDATLDVITNEYGVTVPLIDLLYADPYPGLTDAVKTGQYIGVHTVDGQPCHHLLFTQQTINWENLDPDGGRQTPASENCDHIQAEARNSSLYCGYQKMGCIASVQTGLFHVQTAIRCRAD